MKKIFILFTMLLLVVACSKDDNNEVVPTPEPQPERELMEEISDDVVSFIEEHEDVTYDQIRQQLARHSSELTTVVEDDMMYITSEDGRELQIDLHGVTQVDESDEQPVSDEEIEQIYEEMNSALEIPGLDSDKANAPRQIRTNSAMYAGSSAAQILTKPDILLWAPWGEKAPNINEVRSSLASAATKNGLFLKKMVGGDQCTLESMKDFANYSVVVLACHGNTRGQLCMPMTEYWKKQYEAGNANAELIVKTTTTIVDGEVVSSDMTKTIKEIVLTKDDLLKALPIMNKTILWTIVCYANANGSAIKAAATERKVAAFTGANKKVDGINPINFFSKFAAKFFNGGVGGPFVHTSYKNALGALDKDYDFIEKETKKKIEGVYSVFCLQNVKYKRPTAREAWNNRPLGDVYDPYGSSSYGARSLDALSASYESFEEGFLITNLDTKETVEVPFTDSFVECVGSATYSDVTTHFVYCFNTSNLAAGTYEYCTYLKSNGQTIKSNNTYRFKKDNSLCPDSRHPHAIDMGAAGVWACCNVGASKPEEYGGYYAWGETEEKSDYSWRTYKYWHDKDGNGYAEHGELDDLGDISGNKSYDVAAAKWGGRWCMPTLSRIKDLINSCSYEWTKVNGVVGGLFTAPNGHRIFLPAEGYRSGSGLYNRGYDGIYWSSTPSPSGRSYAYNLYFNSGDADWGSYGWGRMFGHSVRPVSE